jgi:hypothetical protein
MTFENLMIGLLGPVLILLLSFGRRVQTTSLFNPFAEVFYIVVMANFNVVIILATL